eukprot:TRINITY_DN933_c0_g5_i1.p1 TRINITY_DN933_c0_g5~~TRINITY_DN933_c0_g5_i1.p1  ORF type:complete len:735 (-),score=244.90 TRINITY_DN933_c0_g5_i1:119-2323(-)
MEEVLSKLIDGRRNRTITAVVASSVVVWFYYHKKKLDKKSEEEKGVSVQESQAELEKVFFSVHEEKVTNQVGKKIDKKFLNELKFLINIIIPGWRSKEFFILVLHTSFLFARTFASLYVARLDGLLVKNIVEKNLKTFIFNLMKWFLISLPACYINSMIRFLENKLSLSFRSRLTQYTYDLYLQNDTYYRVTNLDDRLSNVDQTLTEDISKFSHDVAHIYSHLSKPLFDVVLMGSQLLYLGASKTGFKGTLLPTAMALGVVAMTAQAMQLLSPPFGKLAARQAQLEGRLRFCLSRLISHSEEVVLHQGGEKREKGLLWCCYLSLAKHINYFYKLCIPYQMLEGFMLKYLWSATGMVMIATSLFSPHREKESVSSRTGDFITIRKLLFNTSEAVEKIMGAYKHIGTLAGYTSRIYNMITVFREMEIGKFQKKLIMENENQQQPQPQAQKSPKQLQQHQHQQESEKVVAAKPLLSQKGKIETGDRIEFDSVPIVTPNGDVLIKSLSLEVNPGQHVLISGPNGCGKSSLFRILGELWPVYGGRVVKPKKEDLFYIPQRPYLPLGSLRDQIIYPHSAAQMQERGVTDRDLEKILGDVSLGFIVEREGGWDAVQDWKEVLSGGEKQKVAMARLFYHRPRFAILDECSSAISVDVESQMYSKAKEMGITLITITHRPTLWPFHDFLLQFDGQGKYLFTPLAVDKRLSLEEEKIKIEEKLVGIPEIKRRLKELSGLLGEKK